jgi:MerR family regulatory protein
MYWTVPESSLLGAFLSLTITTACRILKVELYSISEAARRLRVHRSTLHRWIEEGLVPQPLAENIAGARLRYWTKGDFAKVEEYKRLNYWGQGKKRPREPNKRDRK